MKLKRDINARDKENELLLREGMSKGTSNVVHICFEPLRLNCVKKERLNRLSVKVKEYKIVIVHGSLLSLVKKAALKCTSICFTRGNSSMALW